MAIFNLNGRKTNQPAVVSRQTGQQLINGRGSASDGGSSAAAQASYSPAQNAAISGGEREKYILDFNTQVDKQIEEFTQKYPDFNASEEMANPVFRQYIWSMGLTVEEAFLLVHGKEILEELQQLRAQTVRERIPENGTGRLYPMSTRTNVSELTDEELDEIAARVQKGERISFD